jgi:hypothetical protein
MALRIAIRQSFKILERTFKAVHIKTRLNCNLKNNATTRHEFLSTAVKKKGAAYSKSKKKKKIL